MTTRIITGHLHLFGLSLVTREWIFPAAQGVPEGITCELQGSVFLQVDNHE